MSILNDKEITERCQGDTPMIAPFLKESIKAVEMLTFPTDRNGYSQMSGSTNDGVQRYLGESDSFGSKVVKRRKILSMGLSSYGYDVSLSDQDPIKIFTNVHGAMIDPKNFDERSLVDVSPIREKGYEDQEGDVYVVLPPHSYLLGATTEYFKVPRDIMIIALGKSTYARCGIMVNVTPIEPGFEGQVVMEIANQTSLPAKIYLNEGIAQFLFLQGNPVDVSYGDRAGKYHKQTGVTLAKV